MRLMGGVVLSVFFLVGCGSGSDTKTRSSKPQSDLLKQLPDRADVVRLRSAPTAYDGSCVWVTSAVVATFVPKGSQASFIRCDGSDDEMGSVFVSDDNAAPADRIVCRPQSDLPPERGRSCDLVHGHSRYMTLAASDKDARAHLQAVLKQVISGEPAATGSVPTRSPLDDLPDDATSADRAEALLNDPSPSLAARLRAADAEVPGTEATASNIFDASCSDDAGAMDCKLTRASTFATAPTGSIMAVTLHDVRVENDSEVMWSSVTYR